MKMKAPRGRKKAVGWLPAGCWATPRCGALRLKKVTCDECWEETKKTWHSKQTETKMTLSKRLQWPKHKDHAYEIFIYEFDAPKNT